jgi:hypothetical protein
MVFNQANFILKALPNHIVPSEMPLSRSSFCLTNFRSVKLLSRYVELPYVDRRQASIPGPVRGIFGALEHWGVQNRLLPLTMELHCGGMKREKMFSDARSGVRNALSANASGRKCRIG